MRRFGSLLTAILCTALVVSGASKKQKKEEMTQTHEVLPDPPTAITVETARLEFVAAPLSNKGLLSQQTREGIKTLQRLAKNGSIVKIRAWVAGTGDLRRIGTIVSEVFSEKKLPLPAVSVIQIGLLPLEGAQVQLEAVISSKKPVNPNGLAFLSGMGGTGKDPMEKLNALTHKAISDLTSASKFAGADAEDMLRVTCLVSSLDQHRELHEMISKAFNRASITIQQSQRAMGNSLSECEGILRLRQKAPQPVYYLSPKEMSPSPNYSKVVMVSADRIIMTGTQLAFHYEDADVRLAFGRMAKVLEQNKGSIKRVVFSNFYPISGRMLEKVRNIRFEFFDKEHPPAATMIPYEGLPGMDASMAIELIAVP